MCAARIEDGRSPSSTSDSFNGLLAGVFAFFAAASIGERVRYAAFAGPQRPFARRGPPPIMMPGDDTVSTKRNNARRLTQCRSQRGKSSHCVKQRHNWLAMADAVLATTHGDIEGSS